MDKLTREDGQSPDFSRENIEKLRELFPEAFTEDGINFDVLRQLLGDDIDDNEERYSFTWHGKSRARRIAQQPSSGTLLPCPEDSVNWDTTKNIFIEGDNLEVLKLLQKSYHRKVKMIYIDPPYNTGKEFIYPDKYQDNLDTYLRYTGQVDDDGFRVSTNSEASGRYHTNWLNMMFPRLKLARNLLRDDGVIFISIDDHEANNLVKLCDEVFGEENKLGQITVVSNLKGRSDDKYFATAHNYLICYAKSAFQTFGVPLPAEYLSDYNQIDGEGRRYRLQGLRKRGTGALRADRPNMFYPLFGAAEDGSVSTLRSPIHNIEIVPKLSDGSDGRWRWGLPTATERSSELTCRPIGGSDRYDVFQIDYAEGIDGRKRIVPKTVWQGKEFANEAGTLELKRLFGSRIFDNPKPTGLLEYCLQQATQPGDLVLDFFAGSATTAHAVFKMDVASAPPRRFLLIQLPETTFLVNAAGKRVDSEASSAGFRTIADIAKERMRKAAAEVASAEDAPTFDQGFRVFKLSDSNMTLWNADFGAVEQHLLNANESTKPDRSEDDLLYEILLRFGLDIATTVECREIEDCRVSVVGTGTLVVCLADNISLEVVKGIADLRREFRPEVMRVVFKDAGFEDDVVKANATQILRQAGIEDVKSI